MKNKRLCEDIYNDDSFPNCPVCDGSGTIVPDGSDELMYCPNCGGAGKLVYNKENEDEEIPKEK